jgi:hypothetical protein
MKSTTQAQRQQVLNTTQESTTQARMSAPDTSSSTLRQGDLAQKLLAIQQEKNRAIEDMKIAVLEAKYTAEVKRVEENAKRKLEQ